MLLDHLVICGFGKVGALAAQLLASKSGTPRTITIIERDSAKAEKARKLGHRVIVGDAATPSSLRVAQVAAATEVLVCVGDAAALHIIQHLHRAAPQTIVKVVLRDRTYSQAASEAGASEVIVLSSLAGGLLAESALRDD